jgi:hypothetical protein
MFFRVKRTGPYAYLQIVESFRQDQRVCQRVLSTLPHTGRLPPRTPAAFDRSPPTLGSTFRAPPRACACADHLSKQPMSGSSPDHFTIPAMNLHRRGSSTAYP